MDYALPLARIAQALTSRASPLARSGDSLVSKVTEYWNERRLGIDTMGLRHDPIHEGDRHEYCPAHYGAFRTLMRHVRADYTRSVFVDYGCGMGRIVCAAAQHPFRRIVGIELSEDLAAMARRNVALLKRRKSGRIDILDMDATLYDPPAEATVLFFYNPFAGQILADVLERVRASLERDPRTVWIVYVNDERFRKFAKEHGSGWITQIYRTTRLRNHYSCGVYTAAPPFPCRRV